MSVGSRPKLSSPATEGRSTSSRSRMVTRVLRNRSGHGIVGEIPKWASNRVRLRSSAVAAKTFRSSNTNSRLRSWNRRASSVGSRSRLVEPTRR